MIVLVADAPPESKKPVQPGWAPADKVMFAFLAIAAGLRREHVYTTTYLKQPLSDAQRRAGLDVVERAIAGADLEAELESREPSYILALGRYAAAHFLGKEPEEVSMETIHGIPFQVGNRVVMPAFHAGAGFKDSKRLAYSMNDLKAFAELLAGHGRVWTPKTVKSDYQLVSHAGPPVYENGTWTEVAIDTEYDGDEVLMLTYSWREGMGRAILADDQAALAVLRKKLEADRPTVVFHNALADLIMLKRMGIDVVAMGLTIRDTMIRAWYRETEGQGLKRLAFRHLGVDRSDFEGLVAPYFESALINYLEGVKALTAPAQLRGKKGQLIKKWAPSSPLYKKAHRFTLDYAAGRVTDALKRWEEWDEAFREEAEDLLGTAPTFSLKNVPLEVSIPYAASDTDDTLGVYHKLTPYSNDLEDMDSRKLPMIAAMMERGMKVDLEAHEKLKVELRTSLETQLAELREMAAWPEFNPRSGDDIAQVLFGFQKEVAGLSQFLRDKEYLTPPSFTKTGKPKTDKKALGMLRNDHALPAKLLAFKEVEKLNNTYVEKLGRYLKNGILHPNVTHTRVPSGRLAMRRPNMMAIPSRTALGLRVRNLFVPRPGFRFVNFDHSQIELRLAAEISQDEVMLELFRQGVDMHLGTAAKIGGKDPGDTEYWTSSAGKLYRTAFKKINFGILFGATPERIYLELLSDNITTYTLEDVKQMVHEWFELYTGVAEEIKRTEAFIQQNGYVEDMWGRRRQLPGAYLYGRFWPMSFLREEAVRQGFNHKIQGGAQGLLIRAMLGFWEEDLPLMASMGYTVIPVLQVHDELVFEIVDDPDAVEIFTALGMQRMLADQERLSVPIDASSSNAYSWGGLK